jgi:predicted anti-sigma-YlaC factor YlaD
MKALGMDFFRRRRSVSLLGWALMLAGGTGLGVAVIEHLQAREGLRAGQDRMARQERQLRVRPLRPVAAVAPDEAQAQTRATAALHRPWNLWLRELERLSEKRVALLALEMQGASGEVRITAEAPDMAAAAAYADTLRRSPLMRSVVLGTHEARRDGAAEVVRFTLDLAMGTAP